MKIIFWVDSLANVHSKKSVDFNPNDYGYTEADWKAMNPFQKGKVLEDWLFDNIEYGYEEEEDFYEG